MRLKNSFKTPELDKATVVPKQTHEMSRVLLIATSVPIILPDNCD